MKIRRLHRTFAIAFSPLFLFSAISGAFLLFRKAGLYNRELKELVISLHTWEIVAPYLGLVVAFGLAAVAVSGIILFFKKNA